MSTNLVQRLVHVNGTIVKSAGMLFIIELQQLVIFVVTAIVKDVNFRGKLG
jgi:glycopeptide antibiotics resistance protein